MVIILSPLDPSGQWSRLMEKQRQQQEQLDKQEKDENEQRKRLYREELQRLMDEQKLQNVMKSKNDVDFNGQQTRYLQSRDQEEYHKIMTIKNKEHENAVFSLEQENMKRESMRIRLLDERNRQKEFNSIMNEAQKIEQINKLEQKNRIKQDLTSAYQVQEDQKKLDSIMNRMQEQQMSQEYMNKLQQQDQQRQNYLNRLKQGYQQNNTVLQKYNEIYLEKEYQQRELQRKLIEEAAQQKKIQEDQRYFLEKINKEKLQQQTMAAIKDQIEQKQISKQEQQNKKYQEQEYLVNMKDNFARIDQETHQKRYQVQNRYRDELKIQMEQDKSRRVQEASMSSVELNLNRQLIDNEDNYANYGIGVVPGLSNHVDYQRQKQKQYIDSTLNKSVPNSYASRSRQRNQSAYVAGNNITNNIFGYK